MRGSGIDIAAQVAGLVLAPLVPGTIQSAKARLQGRRGTSPLQPYRELRRLWTRSVVAPDDSSLAYALAPSVEAAALACSVLVVPVAGATVGWLGTDMFVLVGLLALARFATAASAWDPGGGFSLMGAGRDLMFSVFAEPLLMLALLLVAIGAGSTELTRLVGAAGDGSIAGTPAHWCAALAFGLVILVETGRQPIDNPDTHLELTMVHEGPLLEYAGRDVAMLHWASTARHWVVVVLAIGLFIPLPASSPWSTLAMAGSILALCVVLALVETSIAKMRILRVPALLGTGIVTCAIGFATWIGGGSA